MLDKGNDAGSFSAHVFAHIPATGPNSGPTILIAKSQSIEGVILSLLSGTVLQGAAVNIG